LIDNKNKATTRQQGSTAHWLLIYKATTRQQGSTARWLQTQKATNAQFFNVNNKTKQKTANTTNKNSNDNKIEKRHHSEENQCQHQPNTKRASQKNYKTQ
jgi:lipopolysaccharide export LptBFGC system permease protein LptF